MVSGPKESISSFHCPGTFGVSVLKVRMVFVTVVDERYAENGEIQTHLFELACDQSNDPYDVGARFHLRHGVLDPAHRSADLKLPVPLFEAKEIEMTCVAERESLGETL